VFGRKVSDALRHKVTKIVSLQNKATRAVALLG
jgi:hypothetical protein